MPGTAVTQPNYADSGQTGSAYPTAIDAITQAMARIAAAFNPHAVPAAAAAPVLSSSAGGALGARTYYSKITLVTPAGEVKPSAESNLALVANTLLNVASPTFALGVTGWNVYVSTATGTETKQNSTPIAIGTAWVEPTSGLIAGAALPVGLSLMAVIVDAGVILNGITLTEVAAQSTGTITAPVTNPRIDRVVIDILTGAVSVITGAEAGSPTAPAITAGKLPIAQVALATSTTTITNALLTDERPPYLNPTSALRNQAAGADIASAATVDLTAATGNSPRITGVVATSAVTMNPGQWCLVVANAAWPLTYHATTNKISGGASYTLAAGDQVLYHKDLSGIVHGFIMKADGTAVVGGGFAISAEVKTGTVTDKSIAPAALLAALGFSAAFISAAQTITSAGALTIAHGLGRGPPKLRVMVVLRCLTADAGFSVGDYQFQSPNGGHAGANRGVVVRANDQDLFIRYGNLATYVFLNLNPGDGVATNITNTSWDAFFIVLA